MKTLLMDARTYSTPAFLWDGKRQLPGTLELWEHKVIFRFDNFRDSHLNLVIPIWEILRVEEFLLFEVSRNGLCIENRGGQSDCFVLDEPGVFKNKLRERVAKEK